MPSNNPKPLTITPLKGRPMLHWVGKRPLDVVRHFPAQLCETVGVKNPSAEPSQREFAKANYNLLFHGDNKEILSSLLIAGFRGKIDLIYIDPPFDSGADYVRRVKLRGQNEKLEGEGHTSIEQAQYEDIWANDNYLQFMYERLILLRELLSEKGSIYLHCDWHKSHHLRFLLDEVFGAENFANESIGRITDMWHIEKPRLWSLDSIFFGRNRGSGNGLPSSISTGLVDAGGEGKRRVLLDIPLNRHERAIGGVPGSAASGQSAR